MDDHQQMLYQLTSVKGGVDNPLYTFTAISPSTRRFEELISYEEIFRYFNKLVTPSQIFKKTQRDYCREREFLIERAKYINLENIKEK